MTFLECINRILRQNTIIRGDTDTVSSFSQIQHNATVNIGIIAVQNELTNLIADRLIPRERKTSGSITTSNGIAAYDLPIDFIRFFGTAKLKYSSQFYFEYAGGLDTLQLMDPDYDTTPGDPSCWYFNPTDSDRKQIGFWQVPSTAKTYTFDYEASVLPSSESDPLPFQNSEESFTFTDMASRRFKFMFEDVNNQSDIQAILDRDMSYRTAKGTLMKLIRGTNPSNFYGNIYA
jgi:hypothetical protein